MEYSYRFEDSFLGKVITLDNGKIEFSVTLEVGPRIISLKAKNGLNVMYEDVTDSVSKDCSAVYGEGERWHIYGGHRLWLSPEDLTTYYPDNNKINYKLTKSGILVYPEIWKIINVQPQILIEFTGDNKLKVTHKVKNLGEKRKLCLWALTVMKAGGTMTFDMSKEDTGYLANRNIVMWSYSSMNDSRIKITDEKIVATSDVAVPNPYKIGAFKQELHAEYIIKRDGKSAHFIKEATGMEGEFYPDYCCNFECYFSDKIHEVESLSSVKEIENGQEIEHTEFWEIY